MEFKRMTLEAPVLDVVDPEIKAMRQDLAKKAKSVLGYGLFENYLRAKADEKKTNSLVHALVELEQEPLDTKEVEAYQKNQRKLKNKEAFWDLPWCGRLVLLWDKMADQLVNYGSEKRKFFSFFLSGFVGTVFEICALINYDWLIAAIVSPFAFFFISRW